MNQQANWQANAFEKQFHVLGVKVDAVQILDTVAQMEAWIARRDSGNFICVTGMHGVSEALHDPLFKQILNSASLVVPDGYPLLALGRRKGFRLKRRVCGTELMAAFFQQTETKGYRHFLYGGAPSVADELGRRFRKRFSGVQIVGTYCPPYRPLTEDEEQEVIVQVREARVDVLWVGLSTPKQERWMARFRSQLDVPVMVGVGAAFDFHTGRARRAPAWMGEHGLEWLFRLALEPRRLWRRYILNGSEFALNVALELLHFRKYD